MFTSKFWVESICPWRAGERQPAANMGDDGARGTSIKAHGGEQDKNHETAITTGGGPRQETINLDKQNILSTLMIIINYRGSAPVAVAGYFLGGANFIYTIFSGAKMSLFSYIIGI